MSTAVTEEQVLTTIGRVVLVCQSLEAAMRLCMTFVFQGGKPLTLDTLEELEKAELRKTIGQFITTLRARVALRDDFNSLLSGFLEHRNQLVHRASDIPGWNLQSSAGRVVAKAFTDQVLSEASQLLMIFAGFARAWQSQSGLDDPPLPPGSEEFFAWLDRDYAPLIDKLIGAKDQT